MSEEITFQTVNSEQKIDKCPDCGSKDIGRKNNEIYCKKCGLVFE